MPASASHNVNRKILLVTGGCRSGKSRFAESCIQPFDRKAYFATAEPLDDEMRERIERHQKRRGPNWETFETPIDLPTQLRKHMKQFDGILIDCLTIWVSNLIHSVRTRPDERVLRACDELVATLREASNTIAIVTNEVGSGIVPCNALARTFRDLAGIVNQRVAAAADSVVLMVSGVPLCVKGAQNKEARG